MGKHCVLFGYRGHLAKTKIIPALRKHNVSYTGISRSKRVDLLPKEDCFVYLSIPSQYIIENLNEYKGCFHRETLFIVEKPHGVSKENFLFLKDYFNENDYNVMYNDHYLFKQEIIGLSKLLQSVNINEIMKIEVVLNETQCVNDRIEYFDKVGIILDMYQSHVIVILSCIISCLKGISREKIISEFSKVTPSFVNCMKYDGYKGNNYTGCHIVLNYQLDARNGIELDVRCEKKSKKDEKYVKIHKRNNEIIKINLCNSDGEIEPYEYLINTLKNKSELQMLNENEVQMLWEHMNLF